LLEGQLSGGPATIVCANLPRSTLRTNTLRDRVIRLTVLAMKRIAKPTRR
jgi:hypothetical protein